MHYPQVILQKTTGFRTFAIWHFMQTHVYLVHISARTLLKWIQELHGMDYVAFAFVFPIFGIPRSIPKLGQRTAHGRSNKDLQIEITKLFNI